MERCEYTLAEVRAARRLLEDMELGRWPGRAQGVHAPEKIGVLYAAGEVLREVEYGMRGRESLDGKVSRGALVSSAA